MVHELVDCTEMCVGSACTQSLYNNRNQPSVFLYIFPKLSYTIIGQYQSDWDGQK